MVIYEDQWHSHQLPSVWQWSYHFLFLRLRSFAAGIRTPNLPLARRTLLPDAPPPLFCPYVKEIWCAVEDMFLSRFNKPIALNKTSILVTLKLHIFVFFYFRGSILTFYIRTLVHPMGNLDLVYTCFCNPFEIPKFIGPWNCQTVHISLDVAVRREGPFWVWRNLNSLVLKFPFTKISYF